VQGALTLLESSLGKARIPDYVSRFEIHEIARAEISDALRDYRTVVISQVAPVVKREVTSEIEKMVKDEIAKVRHQIVSEVADQTLEKWKDLRKRQDEEERRSVILTELFGDKDAGLATHADVMSDKSPKPRARGEATPPAKEDARRWTDLMRDEEPTSSSYRDRQGPDFPGLKEIRPINELFKRALSYKTYRLRDRNANYDGQVAQQLTKTCRRMKHAMPGEEFTGEDEIAVLAFLKKYKYACDETGVAEGAALPLLKYFMGGEAKATMLTYIGLNDEGAQPGVDSINAYAEAVQWLLLTYARESVLHDAYREVRDMIQGVGEKEQQFAARLRKAAIRCGDVFKEQDLITIYVGGLRPHARYAVRESLSRTDKRTFQQIREHAQSLGDTFREQQRELTRVKSNFFEKKPSSRRGSVLSVDTDPLGAPAGDEVLAVMSARPSYRSSVTPPSYSHTPSTHPSSGKGPALARGMIRVPSGTSVDGGNLNSKPEEPLKFRIARGTRLKPFYCLLCRQYGHALVDCDFLTDEQHEHVKKLQKEIPLTEAERRYLKDVRVALAELRPDAFGSDTSSNSDSESGDDPVDPKNLKEGRN